jgi:hypothetical protein
MLSIYLFIGPVSFSNHKSDPPPPSFTAPLKIEELQIHFNDDARVTKNPY